MIFFGVDQREIYGFLSNFLLVNFYALLLHPNQSFPSFLLPQFLLLSLPPTPPLFLFRYGRATPFLLRLNEAILWEEWIQKQAIQSETAPALTFRSLKEDRVT